jgi:hypothetical protein
VAGLTSEEDAAGEELRACEDEFTPLVTPWEPAVLPTVV